LLCPGHHLQVHEGNLSVAVRDGKFEFRHRLGLKLEPVLERSDDLEAAHDGATPVWDGSRLHLGVAIERLFSIQSSRDRVTC
jgi:hypothetical protein